MNIKIELKKEIIIKHNKTNVKTFKVKHILYCDHIQNRSSNMLLLYCGHSFQNKNIIDKRDDYMKRFINTDNCGYPDYIINIKDYKYTIKIGL
tara:strand:- start:99 stop:377 length:279 start_codon:yes stop_codon:yes gene_type:complete